MSTATAPSSFLQPAHFFSLQFSHGDVTLWQLASYRGRAPKGSCRSAYPRRAALLLLNHRSANRSCLRYSAKPLSTASAPPCQRSVAAARLHASQVTTHTAKPRGAGWRLAGDACHPLFPGCRVRPSPTAHLRCLNRGRAHRAAASSAASFTSSDARPAAICLVTTICCCYADYNTF